MALVALLSNPRATGNRALLPRVREYCVHNPDIFHYEIERVDQIGEALRTIAMVRPRVIAINGGDGTVQAVLTELYSGDIFNGQPPPVAVLPNGKTNLIAFDLGAEGSPLRALERVLELARHDLAGHIIERQLIALDNGGERSVLGMFLGGAGLADVILYCRHKIYPLGLPNSLSHILAALATLAAILFQIGGRLLPPRTEPVRVSLIRQGALDGRFSVLIVTTLEKMLLSINAHSTQAGMPDGRMKLLVVDRSVGALLRLLGASWRGQLGRSPVTGVHFGRGDEIRIEGERSSVILDGELFEATRGRPIVLTSTAPVPFVRLAA